MAAAKALGGVGVFPPRRVLAKLGIMELKPRSNFVVNSEQASAAAPSASSSLPSSSSLLTAAAAKAVALGLLKVTVSFLEAHPASVTKALPAG